jgi:hypothetical protein
MKVIKTFEQFNGGYKPEYLDQDEMENDVYSDECADGECDDEDIDDVIDEEYDYDSDFYDFDVDDSDFDYSDVDVDIEDAPFESRRNKRSYRSNTSPSRLRRNRK